MPRPNPNSVNDDQQASPWDSAAEQAVLGAILLDNAAIVPAVAVLEPAMFYCEKHRLIFAGMRQLHSSGRPVDPVTLRDVLDGNLDRAGGMEYLGTLIDQVPFAANVQHHAKIVHEHAARRRLIAVSRAVIDGAYQHRPPAELVQQLTALPPDVVGPADLHLYSAADLLEQPDLLKPPEPIVPRLAYRGRVSMLAAREKLGKSTLLTAGAAAVTWGGAFLGEATTPGVVLWVTADLEAESDILARVQRFGADPTRWHILRPDRTPDLASLTAAIARVAPVLVIIDTLAAWATVSDPFSSAEWLPVLLPLRRLAHDHALAIALAHHATKAENGGYRDSTAIGANVDLILEMHPDGEGGRRKVRTRGRWPATDFTVDLVGNTYHLLTEGTLSFEAQVLAFIQQHPRCTTTDVRASLQARTEDVQAALVRLGANHAVTDVSATRHHHAWVASGSPEPTREPGEEPPW